MTGEDAEGEFRPVVLPFALYPVSVARTRFRVRVRTFSCHCLWLQHHHLEPFSCCQWQEMSRAPQKHRQMTLIDPLESPHSVAARLSSSCYWEPGRLIYLSHPEPSYSCCHSASSCRRMCDFHRSRSRPDFEAGSCVRALLLGAVRCAWLMHRSRPRPRDLQPVLSVRQPSYLSSR